MAAWSARNPGKDPPQGLASPTLYDADSVKAFAAAASTGITLIAGRLKAPEGTTFKPGYPDRTVHAVKFSKTNFDVTSAKKWLDENKYYCSWSWVEDEGAYTFIIMSREQFESVYEVDVPSTGSEDDDENDDTEYKQQDDGEDDDEEYKQQDDGLYAIEGAEIFATGEWNGDQYTTADLDAMVAAFLKVGFQVPIKLGHAEEAGAPAWGWVRNLRRVGTKLVADFADLPEKLYEFIKEHRYDHISAEIYWNLKRAGKKFRRVLKAVALLGAETPAVSDLKPLRAVALSESDSYERVHITTPQEKKRMAKKTVNKATDPRERLAQLKGEIADARTAAAESKDYTALSTLIDEQLELTDRVAAEEPADVLEMRNLRQNQERLEKQLKDNAERDRIRLIDAKVKEFPIPAFREHLRAMYHMATMPTDDGKPRQVEFRVSKKVGDSVSMETSQIDAIKAVDDFADGMKNAAKYLFEERGTAGDFKRDDIDMESNEDPAVEVDRQVKQHRAKNASVSYAVAMKAVLDANPDLKRRYAARRH